MTKALEECRLCLTKLKPKNLTSLFQSTSGVFYSDMVKDISNIKISQDDGLPDKLCHTCRRKVKELYDFKLLIQSSDQNLRAGLHPKKLIFSNISDVKLDISLVKTEKITYEDFTEKLSFDDKENIIYNDIVIRKLQPSNIKVDNNLLLIDDFLDSINNEYGDDDEFTGHTVYDEAVETDYGPSSNEEGDLEPTLKYLEDLPLAMRKIIKQNQERAKRLEQRRLREEEEDEDWNMPAQAQKKVGVKKTKEYPKDLNAVKINFKPPLTKTKLKPEVWNNLRLIPNVTTRKQKQRSRLCPHCGLQPKNLWTHLKTHTGVKQFTCELCPNRSYYTKGGYSSHMLKHGERSYKCETCTATFFTLGMLKKHQTSHGEKTFKCSYCEKMFKWRTGWLRHEKNHNVANKNIICEMCNMSFFSNSGLRHHMRIHTGERPFKCEICNQPYSYKHDFNRHCMNKHGVFLKRRDVRVMNEEVLEREQEITRGLVLRAHGIVQEGEPYNPFEKDGPRGAMAFNQFLKDVKKGKVPLQLDLQDLQLQDT